MASWIFITLTILPPPRLKNVISPGCHGRWTQLDVWETCPCKEGPHFIFVWVGTSIFSWIDHYEFLIEHLEDFYKILRWCLRHLLCDEDGPTSCSFKWIIRVCQNKPGQRFSFFIPSSDDDWALKDHLKVDLSKCNHIWSGGILCIRWTPPFKISIRIFCIKMRSSQTTSKNNVDPLFNYF